MIIWFSSRIQEIQATMTERCIELLHLPPSTVNPDLPKPSYLLDIGCGSGLSGELLSDDGHIWAGVDVSASMLGSLPFSLLCYSFFSLVLPDGPHHVVGNCSLMLTHYRSRTGKRIRRRLVPTRYRTRIRFPTRIDRRRYLCLCPSMALQRGL